MKWNYHFKGNNSQNLLPMMKFNLSRKIIFFWKVVFSTMSLAASQSIFLLRWMLRLIHIVSKMYFEKKALHNEMKCYFVRSNVWPYKLNMCERFIQHLILTHGFQCTRVCDICQYIATNLTEITTCSMSMCGMVTREYSNLMENIIQIILITSCEIRFSWFFLTPK